MEIQLPYDHDGPRFICRGRDRMVARFTSTNTISMYHHCPAMPVYGIYISQLIRIRYSKACASYNEFLHRELLLTMKLLNHGFIMVKLKSSLRKLCGHHHDLFKLKSSLRKFYSRHHDLFKLKSSLRKFYSRHHDLLKLKSSLRKFYSRHHDLFKLKSSLRKFYGHHHDLLNRYGIPVSQMISL